MADVENGIAIDETDRLIASNKVEGTAVYDAEGEKLGSIYNFMVDKVSGTVEYAVLQFGGVFGLGSDYYPLPWEKLSYDEGHGGYVVAIDKAQLEDAPRYQDGDEPIYDREFGERVYGYYGMPYTL